MAKRLEVINTGAAAGTACMFRWAAAAVAAVAATGMLLLLLMLLRLVTGPKAMHDPGPQFTGGL